MLRLFILFILFVSSLHTSLDKYLVKITNKPDCKSIRNVDYIYLINLDFRPYRYQFCCWQLDPYGIIPYRFSAVNGWDFSDEQLNDMGVCFSPEMQGGHWAKHFDRTQERGFSIDFLRPFCVGKRYVSREVFPGTIGCLLSHLSILKDAYESGYETIWVLEDDMTVLDDPHLLSELIEKLDGFVGENNWDILYTGSDVSNKPFYDWRNDLKSDILNLQTEWFWRPDLDPGDFYKRAQRTIISEDFIKIGSVMRTHSMIIRKSGMKKILDYYQNHAIFIPYDHDLANVPDIQLYSLRYPFITHQYFPTDVSQKNH